MIKVKTAHFYISVDISSIAAASLAQSAPEAILSGLTGIQVQFNCRSYHTLLHFIDTHTYKIIATIEQNVYIFCVSFH